MHDRSFREDLSRPLSSRGRGWSGLEAEFHRIPAGSTKVKAMPAHRFGVHYGPSVNAFCRCDGRVSRRVQAHGEADFVPAGLDGEWQDDADCTILRLSLSAALVAQTAEDLGVDPSRMILAPRFQIRDPGLAHIAWALKAELEASDASDRLYVDSLGIALATRLVKLQSTRPEDAAASSRRLTPRQQRRLREFIDAHLDDSLSVADLAAAAGVGTTHLKALFPATFGASAHQYVLGRRVERAKALLLSGQWSISAAALEAGFAHQSHLAHWMKRLIGVTPRQIVAARR